METIKEKAIESLKEQFKAAPNDEHGYRQQVIINNCLIPEINNNPEFAERILVKGKSTKNLESKIIEWIKQSKNYSPSHNIIFSAAIHYYQEDDPKFIKEIFEEGPLKFGDIQKEFNTPLIKYITGTVIKETIKEVEKKTPKKDIQKKVENQTKEQMSIFDIEQ